jgi:phage protein U
MASEIMMALGEYRFSVSTAAYNDFRRNTAWRWASQQRLGRLPAKQYLGPGEDTIEMGGTIYPHYNGGLKQIDSMRDEAGKGEPLLLVDGLGNVWGKWCILSIEETRSRHLNNGAPLKQDFRLRLENYGEDA